MHETPARYPMIAASIVALQLQALANLRHTDPVAALLETTPRRARARPPRKTALARHGISIRIPDQPDFVSCQSCQVPVFAAGPTGFHEDAPICDACLLERAPELGMLLVLAALARRYSQRPSRDDRDDPVTIEELEAFAHVYDRFASKRAPSRGLGAFLRKP